jgi:hypothetical protein
MLNDPVAWFGCLTAVGGLVAALVIVFALTDVGVAWVLAVLLPVVLSTFTAFLTGLLRPFMEAVGASAVCAFASSVLSAWLLLDWSLAGVVQTGVLAALVCGTIAAVVNTNLAPKWRAVRRSA